MGAPYLDIEGKVEEAFMVVLSDAGIEALATIYAGQEFEEKELPNVIAACVSAVPEGGFNSGNYRCRVRVTCNSSADKRPNETQVDDPRVKHRALVASVRDAILRDGIEADLSAAVDDFTATLMIDRGGETISDGRAFSTWQEVELLCAPSDLA